MDTWARVPAASPALPAPPPAQTLPTAIWCPPLASRAWLTCPRGTACQPGPRAQPSAQGCVLPTEAAPAPGTQSSRTAPRLPAPPRPPSPPPSPSFLGSLNSLYFFKHPLCVQPTSGAPAWAEAGPRAGPGRGGPGLCPVLAPTPLGHLCGQADLGRGSPLPARAGQRRGRASQVPGPPWLCPGESRRGGKTSQADLRVRDTRTAAHTKGTQADTQADTHRDVETLKEAEQPCWARPGLEGERGQTGRGPLLCSARRGSREGRG